MQEHTTGVADRRWAAADWLLLAGLLLLAAGLRLWQLAHTTVAARDSIGFIRVAWQLHQHPLTEWPHVLAHAQQHPVYPLAILAASEPVRLVFDCSLADRMRLSSQLVSALAAILLVLPVFCLGRELFDRRVGFGAAVLLQCLPVSGHILADGMSEAVFLLFAASALFWSVRALNAPRRPGAFALAGLCGALAYLTRPEGALIVAATGLVLLAGQAVPLWRRSTRDFLVCGAALSLSALLLAGPYVKATGRLTVKPAGAQILGTREVAVSPPGAGSRVVLAVWQVYNKLPSQRVWWGLGALLFEIAKGACYAGALAALVGLWLDRQRTARMPGAWMMLLVCLGVAYALWRVVVVVGYLSDRHTLLILLCGSFWATHGLVALGEALLARWPRCAARAGGCAALALPLALALSGLPKTLQPLHEHRAGFREVGIWLAEHTQPVDTITDPLCWSHYYAGRVFLEGTCSPIPAGYRAREFVVLEDAGNAHPRLPGYRAARARVADNKPLFELWVKRGHNKAVVKVYALPHGS